MKKSLVVNLIIWIGVAIAAIAFLAWYHMGASPDGLSAEASGPLLLGAILAPPLLLYAMEAIIGLLLIMFKDIKMGRLSKRVALALGLASLDFIIAVGTPALTSEASEGIATSALILNYVTSAAPILIMMFGLLYALGFAPTDPTRTGMFAKYLPSDHFE